ncbi:hypothetical protein CDQ84_06810 [Clostridium thermosuccinogenes]|uniref:Spo0E family sporulation regulatory protein-aspartic acid phosphatase n=1 Tax=Clostridium thermosuccinogenes TaxID=84032 RepID=A0A2K2FNQ5_9CLOT|nr:aspartyl-phosphate phosphatase Spo0E family protein [Pseudoclostridium thermosuccinogenes]AUS97415.1 hypothetical protein CDO33_13780 [Pseudoclostridium thermosuccinogenes]PNT98234.1 hypothetical protein CDQ85_06310 [Pseudoclostridium thermosuccinogenes]PNU00384.1 hypothetical protein CDQ84_06810 [Pseudoclostridium thermosuccinogenes]
MKSEMEEVRETLNKMMDFDSFDLDETLLISQMMDKLIIEYYKSDLNNVS